MTDIFNELFIIPAEHTIYVAFLVGLIVKFFWIWNIEYQFTNSINDSHNVSTRPNDSLQLNRYFEMVNPILIWILKCIRKKEGSGDDPEGLYPINV